jgi:hypothetical protein
MLVLGVIYPAVVIAIELATRMCAESLFDPMPTYWHTLAISLVPAGNLLLWSRISDGAEGNPAWLAFANGAVMAIAGFYALLFLPLLPIALVGTLIGIGLLPLAPLASFACALKLRSGFRRGHQERASWSLLGGVAAGLVLLLALDLPAAATRLGVQWAASSEPTERERGLTLLRVLGDDDLLLRLCYDAVGRPTGLLSSLVLFGGNALLDYRQSQLARSPEEAREIYYRVHGVAFNTKPVPFEKGRWSRFADFQVDSDHGGTLVGGRVKGLEIASSRIDGSISGNDTVAYLEWTVELRNNGPVDREARLQLALPPGGVVSRATLWVDGEEREAAYAGRGQVRAAYQRVAVQQRRDPLLVTTKGADRILAQAFPVPRNGGTIKFKIGITAPLEIETASLARLTLPAIVDRNFAFPAGLTHSVWIESKQALAASAPILAASGILGGPFRIGGAIDDAHLSGMRQTIAVSRNPEARAMTSHLDDGELIVQEVIANQPQAPPALMLVIDGSARLKAVVPQLIAALDAIAPLAKIGVMIASEPVRQVPMAPWSGAQRQAVVTLLRTTSFAGGQDNAPALAAAMQALADHAHARLLWIAGAQPVSFRDSGARLEQAMARLSRLPEATLYNVEPGPNELLPDAPWAWGARTLPQSGSPQADLSAFFVRLTGGASTLTVSRSHVHGVEALPPITSRGSDHVARLWANERIIELMRSDPTSNREAAIALAARYRLVTPVSGAVVLESRQQFEDGRLEPAHPASVPTVPEPHEWAMIITALAALTLLLWQQRQRRRVAA